MKKLPSLLFAFVLVAGGTGCAREPLRFGEASSTSWPMPDQRSYVMVGKGPAQNAVRAVLERNGFRESENARLRVEVGYAVRGKTLSVRAPTESAPAASSAGAPPASMTVSPASRRTISLCTKQAHVLTLAFVDRASGVILSRGGATLGRCKADEAQVLGKLARAAVLSARDGHTMAGS